MNPDDIVEKASIRSGFEDAEALYEQTLQVAKKHLEANPEDFSGAIEEARKYVESKVNGFVQACEDMLFTELRSFGGFVCPISAVDFKSMAAPRIAKFKQALEEQVTKAFLFVTPTSLQRDLQIDAVSADFANAFADILA